MIRQMKRTLIAILTVLVLFVLLDLLWPDISHHYRWSDIPAFYALFGLIGCVAIVLVSGLLGRHCLERDDDYYDRKRGDE